MSPKLYSEPGAAQPKEQETSDFLLRLCHDLRSCLRSIQAPAELLIRSGETSAAAGFEKPIGFLMDGARRLDQIVNGLAGYAIALEIDPRTFRATSMEAALRSALMKLQKDLDAGGAKVTYDKLPRVPGDPDRLLEVFDILIRNALEQSGKKDLMIHVSAALQPEGWLFSIRDNGPGLDPPYLHRMFQPFERLVSRQGTGLSLATCRIIVEQHGGRIWAESEGRTGFTVYFTLPCVQE